jgi:hypothetical protein
LAWSQVAYATACFLIHAHFTGRILSYGFLAQMRDCSPWLIAGAIMSAFVWLLHETLTLPPQIELPIQVAVGAALYLTFWVLWDATLLRQIAGTLLSRSKTAQS